MRLEEAIERARELGDVVVEVEYKLKKVLLYFVNGELISARIETLGEEIAGEAALKRIMDFSHNYTNVNIREMNAQEVLKLTASGKLVEKKTPGYDQMKSFFFYITPEEVGILTKLAYFERTIKSSEVGDKEAIFDLWKNGIVEFTGFYITLPEAMGVLTRRLLVEHFKKFLSRLDEGEIREIRTGNISRLKEKLKEEGFLLYTGRLPEEFVEAAKSYTPEKPSRERLLEKYQIEKPDLDEIKKLLEE